MNLSTTVNYAQIASKSEEMCYYLAECICLNKASYRYVDEIYSKNKILYNKAAKNHPKFKVGEEKSLEQEEYYRKALGVFQECSEDEFYYLLKMSYKKVNDCVKSSKDKVSMSKIGLKKEEYHVKEVIGYLLATVFLTKKAGKEVDETDSTYNDLCAQFNNLKIIPNTIKGYKYESFSKEKRKVLKAIELNLDKKYPNLKKCVKQHERNVNFKGVLKHIMKSNDLTVNDLKKSKHLLPLNLRYNFDAFLESYNKFNFGETFEPIFVLCDTEQVAFMNVETKAKSNDLQELINLYLMGKYIENHTELIMDNIAFNPDNFNKTLTLNTAKSIDYDDLYNFLFPALLMSRCIESYKDVKKYYFNKMDKIDIEEFEFKNKEINSLKQDKIDIEAKYNSLKNTTDTRIKQLEEENRILKNKIAQMEKASSNIDSDKEELTQLRTLMFEMSVSEEEINTSTNDNVDLNRLNSLNVICLGGLDNWISSMKEKLPNWTFVAAGVENYDPALLKDKDYIFINTKANTHGMYYRAIENKDKDTKLRYINNLNIDRVLQEIEKSL